VTQTGQGRGLRPTRIGWNFRQITDHGLEVPQYLMKLDTLRAAWVDLAHVAVEILAGKLFQGTGSVFWSGPILLCASFN
jgi:hypothetical protein